MIVRIDKEAACHSLYLVSDQQHGSEIHISQIGQTIYKHVEVFLSTLVKKLDRIQIHLNGPNLVPGPWTWELRCNQVGFKNTFDFVSDFVRPAGAFLFNPAARSTTAINPKMFP